MRPTPLFGQIGPALRRLAADQAGNIAPLFAMMLAAVMALIGMGIDYSQLSNRKATLDTFADSTSLAAVTPALLSQTDTASINAATTVFNSQVPSIKGIGPVTLTVNVTDNGLSRTVTVNYQTTSKTSFGGLIGVNSAAISGSSQSIGQVPPNIDFYLLLDNSPSMAIAATTAGINTMVSHTPDQCAFACHESDTSPNDYYGLARSLGVTLRMDLLAQATQKRTYGRASRRSRAIWCWQPSHRPNAPCSIRARAPLICSMIRSSFSTSLNVISSSYS